MNLAQIAGGGSGYKNREIKTASGTFTVPPGVFRLKLAAQGGGASGWSNPSTTAGGNGGRGGNAGSYVAAHFDVVPGEVITYEIGSGGVCPNIINSGGAGGVTQARIGNRMLLIAQGATVTSSTTDILAAASISTNAELVHGGLGNVAGANGNSPRLISLTGFAAAEQLSTACVHLLLPPFNIQVASPGSFIATSGGGGGSSFYGPGGNGSQSGSNGQNAPATSYGAGGGGGGGTVTTGQFRLGGNGTQGCLEIWY